MGQYISFDNYYDDMNHILDTNFEEREEREQREESESQEIKNRCIDVEKHKNNLKLLTNKWLQRKIW